MEKAAKILAVVIVVQLLLISAIFFALPYIKHEEAHGDKRYIGTPTRLEPRNHDISRVEDLFIAFEYEHNTSCTFVMTENFTELSIVLQLDRKLINVTQYDHMVEINATAKALEDEITHNTRHRSIKQWTYKIVGLRYNSTYTLTFKYSSGVAVAV